VVRETGDFGENQPASGRFASVRERPGIDVVVHHPDVFAQHVALDRPQAFRMAAPLVASTRMPMAAIQLPTTRTAM
jgi:hypothetical protein